MGKQRGIQHDETGEIYGGLWGFDGI